MWADMMLPFAGTQRTPVESRGLGELAMRAALLADFGVNVAASVNHADDEDS